VHGGGAAAIRRPPGDGARQGPVQLVGAGAVAKSAQPASIALGERVARDLQELARGEIAQDGAGGGQVAKRGDAGVHLDGSAEGTQVSRQGVGDGLGSARRDGPTPGVAGDAQDEAEGRAAGALQGEPGVRRQPGEERASPRRLEVATGEGRGRAQRGEPEERQR
jgi:hypothetical protein